MHILSHRGIWTLPHQKNSLNALSASFNLGLGIETDVRDCDGLLVISHDPPRLDNILTLEMVLDSYIAGLSRPMLALNIKSDGLHRRLFDVLHHYGVKNYFVFDMSVPDTLAYQHLSMPFAARISEYEPDNYLAKSAPWIWLDSFHGDWFGAEQIQHWVNMGKRIAVVSPELHRRAHLPLWEKLKPFRDYSEIYLCTDMVMESKEYFNV